VLQGGTLDIAQYTPNDQAACLRIFDSNVPQFFASNERGKFIAFLDALPGPFWVARIQTGDTVVGCGGVSLANEGRSAWLRWGMVETGHHRQGVGRQLLETRLDWITVQPQVEIVSVATTAEPSGFFLRMGFELIRVVEHGFGLGIDRYDLMLPIVSVQS
jgi:GNAT superfamily N-acetyltransferase